MYKYICIYIYTYIHVCMCIYTYTYTCIYIYTHVYIYRKRLIHMRPIHVKKFGDKFVKSKLSPNIHMKNKFVTKCFHMYRSLFILIVLIRFICTYTYEKQISYVPIHMNKKRNKFVFSRLFCFALVSFVMYRSLFLSIGLFSYV